MNLETALPEQAQGGIHERGWPQLDVPDWLEEALGQATLIVSVSGGKDSQALLTVLTRLHRDRGWRGQLRAAYADLGRNAWPGTGQFLQRVCRQLGVPLSIVRRERGDLLDVIQARRSAVSELKPFWPSAAARYCTSAMKRAPLDTLYRSLGGGIVISAEGLRGEESGRRRRRPLIAVREAITASALAALPPEEALRRRQGSQRVGLTWYPLRDWPAEAIWAACGTSSRERDRLRMLARSDQRKAALGQWPCHPCYIVGPSGNERSSCILCVLASERDLRNGAYENPDHYRDMVDEEIVGGWSFREGLWLADVAPELLAPEARTRLAQRKMDAATRRLTAMAARLGAEQPTLL